YFAPPEIDRLSIAWFGTDAPNDPAGLRYYVERVFSAGRQVQLVSKTNAASAAALLNQSVFAVVPARLSSDEAAALRDWVNAGKSALVVLSDVQMGPTLAALTGLSEIRVTEGSGSYALFGEVDFKHPIFAPFADPRYSDFTHI